MQYLVKVRAGMGRGNVLDAGEGPAEGLKGRRLRQ